MVVWDNGHEATIEVGNIAHGHFTPYYSELRQDETDRIVTEDVLAFLAEMFSDRVLLWKLEGGGIGGWERGFTGHPSAMHEDSRYFVCSGPLAFRDTERVADRAEADNAEQLMQALSSLTFLEAEKLMPQLEQTFGANPEQ